MLKSSSSIIVLIQILFRNYMITKKVILLALLGLSSLNCADAGPKSRVEEFLAKPTYQADFQKLGDEQKKQLAKDLDEVVDQINGVKKNVLRALCAPFLVKDSKAPVAVSKGGKLKAYEDAAAVSSSLSPARVHVAPGRLSVSSGSDAPSSAERVHVGRLSLDEAPVASPPRAPIVVPGSIRDRLAFFQQQSEQMQLQVAAQRGKKDAAQDKRLLELQVELEASRGPLDEARSALEQADRASEDAERLRQTAIEGEMRAVDGERGASENERLAVESEGKSRGIKESVEAMTVAYELRVGEVDALSATSDITQKKQGVFEKYGILEADSAGVAEGKLARATPAERSVLAADMLSKSKAALEAARSARERMERARAEATITRERAAKSKADAEVLVQQAVERKSHAERILRELEERFRALSAELDAMTTVK